MNFSKTLAIGLLTVGLSGVGDASFADSPSSMMDAKGTYSRNARIADMQSPVRSKSPARTSRRIATRKGSGSSLSASQKWILAVLQAKKADDAAGRTFETNEVRLASLPKVPREIATGRVRQPRPGDRAHAPNLRNEVKSLLRDRVGELKAQRKHLKRRLRHGTLSDETRERLENRYQRVCSRQYALRVQLHRVKNGRIDKRRLNKLYAKLGGSVSPS